MSDKKGTEVREGDHLRVVGENAAGQTVGVLHHLDGTSNLVFAHPDETPESAPISLEPCPDARNSRVYHVTGRSRSDSPKASINHTQFCENWERIIWKHKQPKNVN